MSRTQSTCRSCRAPIFWVRSAATGRPMPVDAQPTPAGNIVVEDHGGNVLLVATVLGPAVPPDARPRYTSHHATCPDAARWRYS